jgi:HAD superfamily, subfamily IIIB (Acid phosphatase)
MTPDHHSHSEDFVKNLLSIKRPARTTTIALASAAAGMAIGVPGLALATNSGQAVPAPPTSPTSASQIQNIDQVKTAIKGYYGDTVTGTPDPVPAGQDVSYAGDTTTQMLHQYNPDGAYAHEVEGIAAEAGDYLAHEAKPDQKHTGTPAVLFDVDDTTLNTYSYEIYSSFVYNPTTNAYFVNAGSASVFPAVPGMAALEQKAIDEGYQVFFLTGRPGTQRDGTVSNLVDAGYAGISAADSSNLYLKDYAADTWLSSCAPSCTTIQYKSLTRQYIESQGYDIVANFGDQFSDLKGGFADQTFKIPNPMYYLP